MPPLDEIAKSVYAKFSISQLRDLALACKLPSQKVGQLRSRESAIRTIDSVSSRDRLALLSHRVEALSPFKHCVLLEADSAFAYESVLESCKTAFPSMFERFQPLISESRDLNLQLCIDDFVSQRIFIKFAHMVEVWETVPSADNERLKTKVPRRHVMVVEINPATQIVSIHFPGFTQVVSGKERVTYSSFAEEIATILRTKLSLELSAFRLKAVTDLLLDDKDEGVVDLRRTLRFKRGGKVDLDSESDEDAASTLAQGLANTGVTISAEAIRLAFRASEAQAVVLLWQKQRIITRASMRNALPELLFIWNDVEASQSLIDDVLKRFARARDLLGADGVREAREYIAKAQLDELLRPFWLEQRFAITREQALQILLHACSSQLCRPMFRVDLEGYSYSGLNPWVSDVSKLPPLLIDDQNAQITTREPRNIEIAFQRIANREPSVKEENEGVMANERGDG